MNLLRNPGNALYGIVTLCAFLLGLLICLTLLVGFGYAGILGDAPGSANYIEHGVVAGIGFLGTGVLFAGLLGTSSAKRKFPILTIIGTVPLIALVLIYDIFGVRGNPRIWVHLVLLIELSTLLLSSLKLKQLQIPR